MNSDPPETDQFLTYVKCSVTRQWEMKDFSIEDETIIGEVFGGNVHFPLYHHQSKLQIAHGSDIFKNRENKVAPFLLDGERIF